MDGRGCGGVGLQPVVSVLEGYMLMVQWKNKWKNKTLKGLTEKPCLPELAWDKRLTMILRRSYVTQNSVQSKHQVYIWVKTADTKLKYKYLTDYHQGLLIFLLACVSMRVPVSVGKISHNPLNEFNEPSENMHLMYI